MTQILNQMHQELLAQQQGHSYLLPANIQNNIQACIEGSCGEQMTLVSVQSAGSTPERQFFNTSLSLCDKKACYQIEQVFSLDSAILKEDRRYHAVTITPRFQ